MLWTQKGIIELMIFRLLADSAIGCSVAAVHFIGDDAGYEEEY
jgi:hypothetical protein